MSLKIDANSNTIILDGEPTLFHAAQHDDKTSVWSIAHPVTMPHNRYSFTKSYSLKPGVAGLDQFEADIRMLVDRVVSDAPKKLTPGPLIDMIDQQMLKLAAKAAKAAGLDIEFDAESGKAYDANSNEWNPRDDSGAALLLAEH